MNDIEKLNDQLMENEICEMFEELYAEEIAEEMIVRDYHLDTTSEPNPRKQRIAATDKKAKKRALTIGCPRGSVEFGKCRNHSLLSHDEQEIVNKVSSVKMKKEAIEELLEEQEFNKKTFREEILSNIEATANDIIDDIKSWGVSFQL